MTLRCSGVGLNVRGQARSALVFNLEACQGGKLERVKRTGSKRQVVRLC